MNGLTNYITEQPRDDWLLAPAALGDAQVLSALVERRSDLVLVGDKGYTDADLEDYLWRTRHIQLLPLRRTNQKHQWTEDIRRILGRIRHGVETVFSVASTVFNLERPQGRSLAGHAVRVATIVLAHTLSFFMAWSARRCSGLGAERSAVRHCVSLALLIFGHKIGGSTTHR